MSMITVLLLLALFAAASAVRIPLSATYGVHGGRNSCKRRNGVVAAVLPGSPLVTGTISQGLSNAVSIYSNIIFFRYIQSYLITVSDDICFFGDVFMFVIVSSTQDCADVVSAASSAVPNSTTNLHRY